MVKRKHKGKARFWFFLVAAIIAGLCGAGVGTFAAFIHESPQIRFLDDWRPSVSTKVYAADRSLLAEFAIEKRTLVRLSEIPLNLQRAFLATEDNRFYEHSGIDTRATIRAIMMNLKARGIVQGGSTITQQLARNLPIGLDKRRTFSRKLKEALLALQIERKFTKDEILELYLNQIYLGEGAYGVESGARTYFGKHVSQLTLAESALLAGLPKGPSRYSPFRDPERALGRRNAILKLMLEKAFIPKRTYDEAVKEPLVLGKYRTEAPFAEYFVEHVRQQLEERQGYNRLYQGGLIVETTLDPAMQRAAESAIKKGIAGFEAMAGSKQKLVQAALIAIEPSTGYIRAMVGGRDFSEFKYNRAVQARRQPGSAFKPFIWALAFDKGYTPSDIFEDAPISYFYRDAEGKRVEWSPDNFDSHFYGPSTLRMALVRSQNVVAVQLIEKLRPRSVILLAHKAGIRTFLDANLSLALGTSVVTPIELASGYATFANKGIHCSPISVMRVLDQDKKVLEENHIEENEAMRAEIAYLVTHILEGTIEDGQGTGKGAQDFTRDKSGTIVRPAAGKTGTTENCIDAWFVAYTPDLAAAVWVGYDDNSSLGDRMTGGRVACPIWTQFMLEAAGKKPAKSFERPDNITFVQVDRDTGKRASFDTPEANVVLEAYVRGTEPRSASAS